MYMEYSTGDGGDYEDEDIFGYDNMLGHNHGDVFDERFPEKTKKRGVEWKR